jgi:hypothetical protein
VPHKRTDVSWDHGYLIGQGERTDERWEAPDRPGLSGKEYCTVDGVEYWRYDCFVDFSPYGWQLVNLEVMKTRNFALSI